MSNTQSLFTPVTLGPLSLNNRVVMAPMTRTFSPGNVPSDDVVEYYRRRAAGGVGLIITEGTFIGHIGANGYPNVPAIYGADALTGWKKVVDAVHAAGGKIASQLWHVGAMRRAGVEPGGDAPGFSPSGVVMRGVESGVAMSKLDIDEVIAAYAQAAKDSKEIGFDAIEIHGAHGYLIDQFLWEGSNQRTDEYGGSFTNRLRFAREVIAAAREAVGPDYPIIFRISQWKQQDFSARLANTPEELEEILAALVEAGADIFHCSTRRFWEAEFEGSSLNLAGWAKKLTGKPSITVGSVSLDDDFIPTDGTALAKSADVDSLDGLLERLENEEFDLVAVGRALIANPDWAEKVQHGHFGELVPYRKEMLASLV